MKKYDKFKNSGIEWIGKIPEHWQVNRIKDIIREKVTDGPHETPAFLDEGIPFLSVDSIQEGELVFEQCRYISKENHAEYKVKCNPQRNDILMGKAASVGKIARVKIDFEFSVWSPLALLKPELKKVTSIFLEYSLKSDYMQHNVILLSNINTQSNIAMEDISRLKMVIPNKEEQITISDYLDESTKKLKKMIENKKRQVELIKENSQIIINDILCKGINHNSFKITGIDWLKKIPVEWSIKKLKKLTTKIGSGKTPKGGSENYPDKGIIFIRSQNVYFDGLRMDDIKHISLETHEEMDNTKVQPNDLLLNVTGASIGRVCLFPKGIGEANVNQHVSIIRVNESINPRFLQYYLYSQSGQANIYSVQDGASKEGLSAKDMSFFRIPNPPLEEQESIVKNLDNITSKIQKSINITESEITKLEEYKKILINDVVTGKMKVTA